VVITAAGLVAGWAVYAQRWVADRHRLLMLDGVYANQTVPPLFTSPIAPWGLWIFGERGQHVVRISMPVVAKSGVVAQRPQVAAVLNSHDAPEKWTITLRYGAGTPSDVGPIGHSPATFRSDGYVKIGSRWRQGDLAAKLRNLLR
jgi:hypothetical protein